MKKPNIKSHEKMVVHRDIFIFDPDIAKQIDQIMEKYDMTREAALIFWRKNNQRKGFMK